MKALFALLPLLAAGLGACQGPAFQRAPAPQIGATMEAQLASEVAYALHRADIADWDRIRIQVAGGHCTLRWPAYLDSVGPEALRAAKTVRGIQSVAGDILAEGQGP